MSERITSDDINGLLKSMKKFVDIEYFPVAKNSYVFRFCLNWKYYQRKIRGTKKERYEQLEIISDLIHFYDFYIIKK